MNPIKVYLQYPWKFPDSPYYKYLVENPPEGIEYLNAEKQRGVITKKRFFGFSNFLKRNIRKSLNILNLSVPNAHFSPEDGYDLIHCAHCLSKNESKPWIADFEDEWQMYIGEKTTRSQKKVADILKKEDCKKILAWTNRAKENLVRAFPEVKEKIEVLYPSIPMKKFRKTKRKKINIIFSGRYFYAKGGLHAIEAIDQLTKQYPDVYGIINSEVPEEIKNKYSKNKKIDFYGLIPQEELFELYGKSDIMIYPGYSDSFGFGFLEAMSFGIPIITVDGFARREIVEDGKTGFVVERPKMNNDELKKFIETYPPDTIDKIVEASSRMIENRNLKRRFSRNCLREISSGKFSIEKRDLKLRGIYLDSLKNQCFNATATQISSE